MELTLTRNPSKNDCTIGSLAVNGKFECYTLEDVVRDKKIHGKTAIPAGKYKIILNQSFRFKRILPLLLSVPNYEGVRIHAGNTAANTEGCLLVGNQHTENSIVGGTSRPALEALMAKLQIAYNKNEPIFITITNGE